MRNCDFLFLELSLDVKNDIAHAVVLLALDCESKKRLYLRVVCKCDL